ncbi:MAG TPA: adenylate/guanylate cyclase domain-containing protein [Acidimicrobiia bacterium]|nr:adenylate/guanylate cyclase domain-containing protein [Acidimicrobiia bacterium]
MDDELRTWLLGTGATAEQIEQAESGGWLALLALDRVLVPGSPRYDIEGLADAAGADVATARALWRALGFADVPVGLEVFTDDDVEALRLAVHRVDGSWVSQPLEHQVRVLSSALARLAAVEAELIGEMVDAIAVRERDAAATARVVVDELDWPTFARLLDHVHRVQLRAALWRRLVRDVVGEGSLAVGFSDLAGYTDLSERLDGDALAALLSRFEELAYDTVAEHGARVVKTIGDEVMYVGFAGQVVDVALDLHLHVRADPQLPAVRTGLAAGPLLARDGDYFGPVVNLASRLTEGAAPGVVLAADTVHDLLAEQPGYAWRVRHAYPLRGMGTHDVYELTRAPAPPPAGEA